MGGDRWSRGGSAVAAIVDEGVRPVVVAIVLRWLAVVVVIGSCW